MTHGHTLIPSKGMCIYCRRQGVRLTDEHIVPYAIGGQHVIDDASCDNCAEITKKFEQDVMREMWGDARIAYNAPTRRKNERKQRTHITLPDPKGIRAPLKIPYSEYPAPMLFYQMDQAGLLQGMPEHVDVSALWQLKMVTDEEKRRAFEAKYPGRLTARVRHVPNSFARLVAKIGYGHVLCELDPVDFRPICVPYILEEKPNVSFVVGGRSETSQPDAGKGYELRTAIFGSTDRIMLMAEVRLLAHGHTPTYHVVVGDVVGKEKVLSVLDRIGSVEPDPSGSWGFGPQMVTNSEHCMPAIWPLPFWTP